MNIDPRDMKVSDLQKELRSRNLPVSGLKQQLIERLEDALDRELMGETGPTEDTGENGQDDQEVGDDNDEVQGKEAERPAASTATKTSLSAPTAQSSTTVKPTTVQQSKQASTTKAPAAPTVKPADSGASSEADKRALRAARFGIKVTESEEEKKRRRMERFNMTSAESEEEKKKARAMRFGQGVAVGGPPPSDELERRKRRLERFGAPATDGMSVSIHFYFC